LNLRPPGPEFAFLCSCPCIFNDIRSSHSFSFLLDDAILWLMGDPEWVTPSSKCNFFGSPAISKVLRHDSADEAKEARSAIWAERVLAKVTPTLAYGYRK